uniref:Transcription factor CBF/NF-Y/archaeal histone domain-containing protein n=1 Tax=Plectus sambesii TaxID=2011161 RepID=A0A914WF54_9BILA
MASSDEHGPSTSGMPAPIRKRRFSTAKIQPTRVKKVMQSDEDIGRMVASVPVAVGRAMEHFAEKLLEAAAEVVVASGAKTLTPAHIKTAAQQIPQFRFLDGLFAQVPTASTSRATGSTTNGGLGGKRRLSKQSSLEAEGEGADPLEAPVKQRRGRPKKVKKTEKSVIDADDAVDDGDDEEAEDIKPTVNNHVNNNNSSNGNGLVVPSPALSDQDLMPPPPLPPPIIGGRLSKS